MAADIPTRRRSKPARRQHDEPHHFICLSLRASAGARAGILSHQPSIGEVLASRRATIMRPALMMRRKATSSGLNRLFTPRPIIGAQPRPARRSSSHLKRIDARPVLQVGRKRRCRHTSRSSDPGLRQ